MKDKKDCIRHFDQFFIDTQATKLMEKCSVELLTSLLVRDALAGSKLHPGFKGVSESDVTHRLSDYFC
jgi:hypothetical protein